MKSVAEVSPLDPTSVVPFVTTFFFLFLSMCHVSGLSCVKCSSYIKGLSYDCLRTMPEATKCADHEKVCAITIEYREKAVTAIERVCNENTWPRHCLSVPFTKRRRCSVFCSKSGCNNEPVNRGTSLMSPSSYISVCCLLVLFSIGIW